MTVVALKQDETPLEGKELLNTLLEQPLLAINGGVTADQIEAALLEEEAEFLPDLSKKKGQAEIKSHSTRAGKVRKVIDDAGKDYVAGIKKQAAGIDAIRRSIREICTIAQVRRREPLTRFEAQEEQRIASHKAILSQIEELGKAGFDEGTDAIQKRLHTLALFDTTDIELNEFGPQARQLAIAAKSNLETALQTAKLNEEREAELKRLREQEDKRLQREETERKERETKEAEERKQRELAEAKASAAEQARKEAEEKAERQRQELLRKQREDAEKAEREKQDLIAKQEAERKAEEDRKRKEQEEAERRAADQKHRAQINNNALMAFVDAGLTEEDARKAVEAIARSNVPNVTIQY